MPTHLAPRASIRNDNPHIFFHGRWDTAPETWSGSGFKINVQNLSSLTLNLGPNTTAFPVIPLGVSVDYAPIFI
ncbi:hypothetical protein C8R43DRAFT_1230410, partial [Mycena crocata]